MFFFTPHLAWKLYGISLSVRLNVLHSISQLLFRYVKLNLKGEHTTWGQALITFSLKEEKYPPYSRRPGANFHVEETDILFLDSVSCYHLFYLWAQYHWPNCASGLFKIQVHLRISHTSTQDKTWLTTLFINRTTYFLNGKKSYYCGTRTIYTLTWIFG